MGIYIFKVRTCWRSFPEKAGLRQKYYPEMIQSSKDIFVYDYERENRIMDYEIRVNNGVREKILIPRTRDSDYWKDVGTIDSFYEAPWT